MKPQAKPALREGARGHFRLRAIAARRGLIGVKRFPVMEQFMSQEDSTRAGGQKVPIGVAVEACVECGDGGAIEPDPGRPRRIVGKDDDGAVATVAVARLDGDAHALGQSVEIDVAERGPDLPRSLLSAGGRVDQRRAPATATNTTLTSGASPSNSVRTIASAWSSETIPVRSTMWAPTTMNMSGTITLSPL